MRKTQGSQPKTISDKSSLEESQKESKPLNAVGFPTIITSLVASVAALIAIRYGIYQLEIYVNNNKTREAVLRVLLQDEINEINSLLSGSGLKVVSTNNGSLDVVREGETEKIFANITFQTGTHSYVIEYFPNEFTVFKTAEDEEEVAGFLKEKFLSEEEMQAEQE